MILKKFIIDVEQDETGKLFFNSNIVDLDKDSAVVSSAINGMTGTVEYKRHTLTLHPANGKSVTLTVEKAIEFLIGNGYAISDDGVLKQE